jgi:hypothetical protein
MFRLTAPPEPSGQHRLMHHAKPLLAAIVAALAFGGPALAEPVSVQWDADGQFVRDFSIGPGKFVEACEKLPRGAKVTWRFESRSPVDFNVHYHEGKVVQYPVRQDQVAASEGTLDAKLEHDYCWMWTNKGTTASALNVRLKRH